MTPEEIDLINQKIDEALETLGEFCDAVQILGCANAGEEDMYFAKGKGSSYARQGMAMRFIEDFKNPEIVFAGEYIDDDDDGQPA